MVVISRVQIINYTKECAKGDSVTSWRACPDCVPQVQIVNFLKEFGALQAVGHDTAVVEGTGVANTSTVTLTKRKTFSPDPIRRVELNRMESLGRLVNRDLFP